MTGDENKCSKRDKVQHMYKKQRKQVEQGERERSKKEGEKRGGDRETTPHPEKKKTKKEKRDTGPCSRQSRTPGGVGSTAGEGGTGNSHPKQKKTEREPNAPTLGRSRARPAPTHRADTRPIGGQQVQLGPFLERGNTRRLF